MSQVGDLDESGFNISPFLRYYIGDALFVSTGVAIGSTSYKEESTMDKYEYTTSTFGLNVGVGYSLMWNDRICIEPSIGIATGSGLSLEKFVYKVTGSVTENEYDAPTRFDIAIGLGINIRLGGE